MATVNTARRFLLVSEYDEPAPVFLLDTHRGMVLATTDQRTCALSELVQLANLGADTAEATTQRLSVDSTPPDRLHDEEPF